MKKVFNKGLFWLAAFVVLLICYAVYDYNKSEKENILKVERSKLLNLNKDQINEIEITRPGNHFLVKRATDGWHIEEPLKDWADNEGVEIFISTAITETALDVVTEGDKIDWPVYGLDKPLGQITFKSTSGETTSFDVSEKRNFEQNIFIRRNKESRVLVGSATWAARLNKGVTEFRDKRLLRHKIASIENADIKLLKSHISIEVKDGNWILTKAPLKKLDQKKVREFLQNINETMISDFLIEGREPTAAEKVRYFLNKPVAELKFKLGDTLWKAILGQAPNKLLFAWTSDPLFVTKIEPGTLEKIFAMTDASLLEKSPTTSEKKSVDREKNSEMKLNVKSLPLNQESQ